MLNHRRLAVPFLAALAIAGCGAGAGGGSSSSSSSAASGATDPKQALLTAAHFTTSQSVRADMTVRVSFYATGPPGSAGLPEQSLAFTMHLVEQSPQRNQVVVTTTVAGRNVQAVVVLYDGALYTSTDGGHVFKTVPIGAVSTGDYGTESAVQYMQSVGTVTDTGSGVVDGIDVENYQADLDSAKATAAIKSAISGFKSTILAKSLGTLKFTDGTLDASVARDGHVLSDGCRIGATMDLSAVDPTLQGSTLHLAVTVSGDFHDYGAPIVVPRPVDVTGTTTTLA
jgi:hypothetical protein